MTDTRLTRSWRHWYQRMLPTYWLSLFILTHLPKLQIPGDIPQSDKAAHLSAYGLLAFFLWRFVETFQYPLPRSFAPLAVAIIGVYGAIDEYLQGFVGRSSDVMDWLSDMLGACIVIAVLEFRRRKVEAGSTRVRQAGGAEQPR